MDALLRDDRLTWDLAQMAGLIEAITGEPLGRAFPFDGDDAGGAGRGARSWSRQMSQYDELERQIREAMRDIDLDNIDETSCATCSATRRKAALEELRRITKLLEEAGLAKRDGSRQLGAHVEGDPAAWANVRSRTSSRSCDRTAAATTTQHNQGSSAEQSSPRPSLGVRRPLPRRHQARPSRTPIFRSGGGTPVQIDVKDLEVHKSESLVTAVDGHRAGHEHVDDPLRRLRGGEEGCAGARHADAQSLPARLPRARRVLVLRDGAQGRAPAAVGLASTGRGTNIQVALHKARQLLAQAQVGQPPDHPDHGRPADDVHGPDGEIVRGWSPFEWPRYSPEAMQETLKEVQRCTRTGITINLFMMANDPSLVQFGKLMTQHEQGQGVFLTSPGGSASTCCSTTCAASRRSSRPSLQGCSYDGTAVESRARSCIYLRLPQSGRPDTISRALAFVGRPPRISRVLCRRASLVPSRQGEATKLAAQPDPAFDWSNAMTATISAHDLVGAAD